MVKQLVCAKAGLPKEHVWSVSTLVAIQAAILYHDWIIP